MNAFMFPATSRALLALSREHRLLRLAQRAATAWGSISVPSAQRLALVARRHAWAASERIAQIERQLGVHHA